MELSVTAKVWNRAALESGGKAPLEGDRALAALLVVHGMVMNGGLDHALEVLDGHEWAAGIAGFHYFGLTYVLEAATSAELGLELLNSKYGALIPEDGNLVTAFEKKYLVARGIRTLGGRECLTSESSLLPPVARLAKPAALLAAHSRR